MFSYFIFHLVAVKNEDDASRFKLARSVLKIASHQFANLQYFNSTFMNLKIVRLVLNGKCEIVHSVHVSDCFDSDKQNIVHLIFICLKVLNEEISEIEKTYL